MDSFLGGILEGLPPEIAREFARHRILDSAQAAEFWGVSPRQWRRMYRAKKVPPPIPIGERKNGWELGTLIDARSARAREAA